MVRHGFGRVLLGLCPFRGAEQFHSRKGRRASVDRADHGHLGDHLGLYRLRGWPVQLHGHTVPARSCRGRPLPRFCIVLHLLVPRQASRAHQCRFHAGAADCGGERRADLDRAIGSRRTVGPEGMAMLVRLGSHPDRSRRHLRVLLPHRPAERGALAQTRRARLARRQDGPRAAADRGSSRHRRAARLF